ncbi:MAG: DMT family transporter [Pseudomonadota bacterium]
MTQDGTHNAVTSALAATLLVMLASIGFGSVPFFAKTLSDAGMAPAAVAASRYFLTALFLLPFVNLTRAGRSATGWAVLSGALVGLGWISFVEALKIMPVASAGLIYMTYPVFTLLIVWLWLRQTPALRAIIAALMILAAAAAIIGPKAQTGFSAYALLMALTAPFTFGFAVAVLTNKLGPLKPMSRIAAFALGCLLGLIPLLVNLEATAIWPSGPEVWLSVLAIALLTALLPQLLYATYAPRIGAAKSAMAGSVELPTMLAIGWLLFGEPLGPWELAACLVVLTAILITPVRPARTPTS